MALVVRCRGERNPAEQTSTTDITKAPKPQDAAALATVTGGATGTFNNDRMTGNSGNNSFDAGAGDDSVRGHEGNDFILGGDGTGQLFGDSGNDTINGGAGSDIIEGGSGADVLNGDDAWGAQGDDQFIWSPGGGNDTINGVGGSDLLVLEDTGLTLQQLLNAINETSTLQARIVGSSIDLTGVMGSIRIGNETISFSQMERLMIRS